MRRLQKALMGIGLGVALALLVTLPVAGQVTNVTPLGIGVADAVSAVNTDSLAVIKYVGSTAGAATVAVAGNNSVAFVVGGAADTTVNPLSAGSGSCGNTAGTLDLTQANCNTLGEFCDQVNSSTNWICFPGAGFRDDVINGKINNVSASGNVLTPNGLDLNWLSSAQLTISLDVRPYPHTIKFAKQGNRIAPNPFVGLQTAVYAERFNITSGGTIANIVTWGVKQNFGPKRLKVAGTSAAPISYSEAARVIWSQAGAATTVEKLLDFRPYPLVSDVGERVIVRETTTTNLTVPLCNAVGTIWRRPGQ